MQQSYQLNYTPRILRLAALTFFKQIIGIRFPILVIILSGFVSWQFSIGNRGWLIGTAIGAIAVVVCIMLSLFVAHLKHASSNAKKLENAVCILELKDDGISFKSPLGNAEFPWSNITSMRRYDKFLFLKFSGGNYTSIPSTCIDEVGIEFIKSSITNHGGSIA
ncbi:YcxB family protein [Pseudomonas sp. NY15366]